MDSGSMAHMCARCCRRTRGYWQNENNVRQELEALAEEQRAETTIEFVEPAQAASHGASKASERILRHPVKHRWFLGHPPQRARMNVSDASF